MSGGRVASRTDIDSALFMSGGRVASRTDIDSALQDGFVDGCACAFDSNYDRVGVSTINDRDCKGISGMPPNPTGVFSCSGNAADAIWCYRYN